MSSFLLLSAFVTKKDQFPCLLNDKCMFVYVRIQLSEQESSHWFDRKCPLWMIEDKFKQLGGLVMPLGSHESCCMLKNSKTQHINIIILNYISIDHCSSFKMRKCFPQESNACTSGRSIIKISFYFDSDESTITMAPVNHTSVWYE